jgi:CRISPR/Cas system-associated endonuclease Cas3-HD
MLSSSAWTTSTTCWALRMKVTIPKQFIGFSASFALLASLDKRGNFVDKSLFKKLLKTQEKAIVVHVYGKAMFRLNAFLGRCCNMSDIKDEIKSATESLYQRMVQSFPLDIAAQHHHVTVWMTRMDSEVDRLLMASVCLTTKG